MKPDKYDAKKAVLLIYECLDLNKISPLEAFSAVTAIFFLLGKQFFDKEELKNGFIKEFDKMWNAGENNE